MVGSASTGSILNRSKGSGTGWLCTTASGSNGYQPIDDGWDALMDPEQLGVWLMENNFSNNPGDSFTFFDHEPWPEGQISNVLCEVMHRDPPFRLAFTWSNPPGLGRMLVEWKLSEVQAGTRGRQTAALSPLCTPHASILPLAEPRAKQHREKP